MSKYIITFFVTTIFWSACLWIFFYRESTVSGDELRTIVKLSDFKSYGSWFLYRETNDSYCLKLSRPIVSERYCVPKSDMVIKNGEGGASKMGVIYKGEWVLKEGRYQGAKEQAF